MLLRNLFLLSTFAFFGLKGKISIFENLSLKCSDKESCTISIKDLTDFKWDRVYIFSVDANSKTVDSTLGFHYTFWKTRGERIIFLEKNKIVYHEDYFPYPEYKNRPAFIELSKLYLIGTKSTSFTTVKHEMKNKIYYSIRAHQ